MQGVPDLIQGMKEIVAEVACFVKSVFFKEERNAATGIEEVLIGCFGLIAGLEDRSMTFMVEFTGEPSGLFYDCVAFRLSVESFQYKESVFFELIKELSHIGN